MRTDPARPDPLTCRASSAAGFFAAEDAFRITAVAGRGSLAFGRFILAALLAAVACHPALATSFAGFLARPLVRGALLMRGLSALARYVSLLAPVHRRESAIFFGHSGFSS